MIGLHASAVLAVCELSGAAIAQTILPQVEFRIVERTGKTAITGPEDAQLNLSVQARAIGGWPETCLSEFTLRIHVIGESDEWGTLGRCLISNPDGTYTSAIAQNSVIGRGGLAAQYTYLAGINSTFNGLINGSAAVYTNGPDQEIILVGGSARGGPFLATPGVDVDGDGNPDTWSGNGGDVPPTGYSVYATIDPEIGVMYFANRTWIDVYRFRYTPTVFQPRVLRFTLEEISAYTATQLHWQIGLWGLLTSDGMPFTASDLAISVNLPAAGACCVDHACTLRFENACPAGGFVGASTCAVNPCDPYGACCIEGVCAATTAGDCTGKFFWSAPCAPMPCPPIGACCGGGGAGSCMMMELEQCGGAVWWEGRTCLSGWCAQNVVCCYGSSCQILSAAWCHGTPTGDASCTPNLCGIYVCCRPNGTCIAAGSCEYQQYVTGQSSCSSTPCPAYGVCCGYQGSCEVKLQRYCYSTYQWLTGGACTPGWCAPTGSCCTNTTCFVVTQARCLSGAQGATQAWTLGACASGSCASAGACCNGTVCTRMFAGDCASVSGRSFIGGVLCGTSVLNPTACCAANFNRVDGVNVIDVFDFLNAWFALDPNADFDRSGQLSMGDVFAFLNAWMVGC